MSSVVKLIFKAITGLFVLLAIFSAFYFTKLYSETKNTVKDMTYNLNKAEIVYLGGTAKSKSTERVEEKSIDLNFETSITNIKLESLNPSTSTIKKNDDHYVHFTLNFKPLNARFVMTSINELGMASSADWKYTLHIAEGVSESDYQRTVNKGESISLPMYIKTSEPLEALGFTLSSSISEGSQKVYLSFSNQKDRDAYIVKNPIA